ncbi:MAG: hydroxymethylbilane synthase [Nitrososphaerota archaeon]
MKLRIGTRGSKLSLIQTNEVVEKLRRFYPEIDVEVKVIKTRGDIDLETPLYMIPQKGIFEKEIDQALARGEIDVAVHSMKDYPTETIEEVKIVAVPERMSPNDVFISKISRDLNDLPPRSRIGTSSLRREAFIKYVRNDLEVLPIRGNVDTRLRKMMNGQVDGLVVAEAGLKRLHENIDYTILSIEDFTPPAGQGALAIVIRRDPNLEEILSRLNDYESYVETMIERKIVSKLRAGCKTPLGVNAEISKDEVKITLSTVSPNYKEKITVQEYFKLNDIEEIVSKTIQIFREKNGDKIIEVWRERFG